MGTCRGLRSIYRTDPHKRMHGGDKGDARPEHREGKQPEDKDKDDEDQDKNPRHAYTDPAKVCRTIFGGKVALETGRERKFIARAVMAVANPDDKITDPRYQTWSHREIMFSRAD